VVTSIYSIPGFSVELKEGFGRLTTSCGKTAEAEEGNGPVVKVVSLLVDALPLLHCTCARMWYVVDALIPATSTEVPYGLVTGYHAVFLPYDVVGPNSTIICPRHPARIVYVATNGFCVPVTLPCVLDGIEPAPHPAINIHTIHAAATRSALATNNAFTVASLGL
jgi:hypothetical protein